jgi:cold shock CspA family protein
MLAAFFCEEAADMNWKVIKLVLARGFGFARDSGGRVMLFHRSELKGRDFDSLVVGSDVEFESERGPEALRAVNVQRPEARSKEALC